MEIQCTVSALHPKGQGNPDKSNAWTRNLQQGVRFGFNPRIRYSSSACFHLKGEIPSHKWKLYVSATKAKKCVMNLREEPPNLSKKKGTIAGAVALIIGTSIGSGILALPQKTSPAGLLPSSVTMTICWAFLLIEALVLVEINVGLLRMKKKKVEGGELEVISIRTMAQETLGEWGGNLATVTYIFLGYSSLVAYSSKSGEILCHLINLPESVSGFFFTILFTALVSVGGTRATDRVNQWLTISMLGLLLAIEVIAIVFGGLSGLEGTSYWQEVPATIPVIIFSLVYHDISPVLCAYLEGDLQRIRASVLIGSVVPLLAMLLWDAIALGLSAHDSQVADPVDLLMSARWSGVPFMVEAFSLLAVGTSLIGTLLSFTEFFKEQLNKLSLHSPATEVLQKPEELFDLGDWWGSHRIRFMATAMVIAPSLCVSTAIPDAFSAATDVAGGYCMTVLYGVLPPAMAWAMQNRESEEGRGGQRAISAAKPTLFGVGLFACGIVAEQILQDLSMLHF
ncbi:hypothetical protein NMG60_11020411 [Bertholletia excelsa]